MVARGARSRAAAHEAFLIRNPQIQVPTTMPNVTVNYQVEVTASTLNIRSEPSTAQGDKTKVGSVIRGTRLDVEREQQGSDHTAPTGTTTWGRIANGQFKGRWFALRWTEKINAHPATPQPPVGTWSVQCIADHTGERGSAFIDNQIARLRGMGYPNAYIHTGNGWCRARVPAGTEKQAQELFPILRDKGFRDAFPVQ